MYIDLVLVEQPMAKPFLCRCLSFSHLKKGNQVMVEICNEQQVATVIDSLTMKKEDKEFSFILNATCTSLPLPKIISKVEYREYSYLEEDDYDFDEKEE